MQKADTAQPSVDEEEEMKNIPSNEAKNNQGVGSEIVKTVTSAEAGRRCTCNHICPPQSERQLDDELICIHAEDCELMQPSPPTPSAVEGVSDVPQRIQEIKERRAKMTLMKCGTADTGQKCIAFLYEAESPNGRVATMEELYDIQRANAIANAPQDIDYLLARVAELEAERAKAEDNLDKELVRWQDGIRDKLISLGVPDSLIDGAGCDSGDPLDFTLAEISQGTGYFIDRLAESTIEAVRVSFPTQQIIVSVRDCGDETTTPRGTTLEYSMQVGMNGEEFHADTLEDVLAQVREWKGTTSND